MFLVFGFVAAGLRWDNESFAVAVYGKVFQLGLGFEGFGVVKMQFGAAADGAEYIYINKNIGVGILGWHDFYATEKEYGVDKVAEKAGILGIGGKGFVAVIAHAIEIEPDIAAAVAAVRVGTALAGGVEEAGGGGVAC